MTGDYIKNTVKNALVEDIGNIDVSAELIKDKKLVEAIVISNDNAVICGTKYFQEAFLQLDSTTKVIWYIKEGDKVLKNTKICSICGIAKSIISAERVALNFLQTLSSTATKTRSLINKISNTKTKLLDTRKTIPNLRLAQKQAVICGGGSNNRISLSDSIMIKENHINALGGLKNAIEIAQKNHPDFNLVVEVESLAQLRVALKYKPSRILCDNFTPELLKRAVQITNAKVPLEASGNIDNKNIVEYAQTQVDYISVGDITKNIKAVDLSLLFIN